MLSTDTLLKSLVSFLAMDGKVTPDERCFLQDTCQRLSIPEEGIGQALKEVRQGGKKIRMNNDPKEMRDLFYLLVQGAVADGRVDPKEKLILAKVATQAGISQMELDTAIEVRLEQATKAAAPTNPKDRSITCPKCGAKQPKGRKSCNSCGVIFAKLAHQKEVRKQAASGLKMFRGMTGMVVQQKRDWVETFLPFETLNQYSVSAIPDSHQFRVMEQDLGVIKRFFLQALRPFEIHVATSIRERLLRVNRPFRFYFHEVSIYAPNNVLIGNVRREFSWTRRIYNVTDARGSHLYQLFGPIFHPWTFEIHQRGRDIGKITKKWSGLGTEMFTNADNFGVQVPQQMPVEHKAIMLGAVFLIDFVHFERDSNNSSHVH